MKTNRLLLVLVLLTVAMQGALLYKEYHPSSIPSQGLPVPVVGQPAQDAPAGISLDLTVLPTRGRSDARVVMVEFSDYECPFCQRHADTVAPELNRQYVASGKVRYAFANNPLPIHPEADFLAIAAICGGEQGRYWEMHDAIFAKRPRTKPAVLSIVQSLQLDSGRFEQCVDTSKEPGKRITGDVEKASQLHLRGTPGFALGIVDGSGHVRIRKLISGAQPLAVFTRALDDLIAQGGT